MLWEADNKMATIRELYQNAGNPNLSHWKDIYLFSIVEASLLTVGLDPLIYEDRTFDESLVGILKKEKPINWQYALMIIKALKQSICLGGVTCKIAFVDRANSWGDEEWEEKIEQLDLTLEHLDVINTHSTKISRKEYQKWLKSNGYIEPPQQNTIIVESQPVTYKQHESVQQNNVGLLPEPTYTTPALEAINGVIREFWISYDPDKKQPPPKQSVVKAWIAENHPELDSDYIQTAIDKICRHPNAKNGGNRKINP